jgi:hypothetical protein
MHPMEPRTGFPFEQGSLHYCAVTQHIHVGTEAYHLAFPSASHTSDLQLPRPRSPHLYIRQSDRFQSSKRNQQSYAIRTFPLLTEDVM